MAKIQWQQMREMMFYKPEQTRVVLNPAAVQKRGTPKIIMCTYQAANVYYYKCVHAFPCPS
jgi:hypothetical protein